jgi:hypothetical protein
MHWQFAHESLHYWFLTFATSYEWEVLRKELRQLLADHNVRSFALYELMGDFDVLLRVWLPQGTSGAFRAKLQNRLEKFSLRTDTPYSVEKVIRHWPFTEDGTGFLRGLDPDIPPPSLDAIERANALMAEGAPSENPQLAQLVADGFVGPPREGNDQVLGVKIVTLIKPIVVLTNLQKRGMAKQLALVLDRQTNIRQRSLYQVDGQDASFVLSCLAPESSFFAFREELIRDLAPLLETAGARTVSYSCASRRLLLFQDFIHAPDSRRPRNAPKRPVKELLNLEESATLEVKGSAFAPLDPWLFGGEELVESPAFFGHGVLRAIVGFLNAEGGSVVIGGLERERYQSRTAKDKTSRLPEFRDIGAYTCPGLVDPTFAAKGWDAYERKMVDLIKSNVAPDPLPLISIRMEELQSVRFCVVDIQPGREIGWHYLQPQRGEAGPQFLVRQGARTVALEGMDADRYKATKS